MAELLLEILSEEIPARMQARAAEDLKRLVTGGLKGAGLEFERAESYVTPRRLALVVDGLPTETPDILEEKRGPKTDAPEKAVNGFLGSVGLSLDQLEKRETDKGEFYFASIEKKGGNTRPVVANIILETLNAFSWPKSMRWANTIFSWVRPIHNVLCVFDGVFIDQDWGLGDRGGRPFQSSIIVNWNDKTFGHRFLSKTPMQVTDFADYKKQLEAANVILDAAERKARIKDGAEKLAAEAGLTLRYDPALLDEVAGLVEWPVPLIGSIDTEFMVLWSDVLVNVMRKHQKYFALEDSDGNLVPKFIVVANKKTRDQGAAIIAGNERVLRARLADAKFFRDQDMAQPLESYVPNLQNIVFHRQLGSVGDKVQRLEILAGDIAAHINVVDLKQVCRAAHLSKADLMTQMVGEFPDLQGTMGGRYASYGSSREDDEVARAIIEHYAPQGPSDTCPTAPVSIAVALADKIDTLVGFWAIDEKPTGSKDPFALRRAALGVIRLVVENRLRVNLREIFASSFNLYPDSVRQPVLDRVDGSTVRETLENAWNAVYQSDLRIYMADRLKEQLRSQGVRHDLISAVFALGGEDDLIRLLARVDALGAFLETEDGANLLTAYKRAANILRIEEKNDDASYNGAPDAKLLEQAEEKALFEILEKLAVEISPILADERYGDAMALLATLRPPVDAYFDHVTVNCDDAELRVNRLRLLSQIRAAMNLLADFSQIEGGER
ncbi:MAG: glycine--tRNA ligase subunit beta [Rhodospirillales bacterium]|jgi:glycyl-tRNA synthetase beta chain|nr:glycine--tRNA ligase subunit beta [Rhodospirillales bacterium]MDP6840853.1 glycine--tRNA ligase subunit beta [Rhodospirillales bacterium]|tara:strand:- start:39 stop:2216 length:2178 start_codon:yes stop_codon:yes gene_type:complete